MPFDPTALVTAMGAQHDPYSWAKDYAKSSDAKEALMRELANKMDIAEFNKEGNIEIAKLKVKAGEEAATRLAILRGKITGGNQRERFMLGQDFADQNVVQDAARQIADDAGNPFEIWNADQIKNARQSGARHKGTDVPIHDSHFQQITYGARPQFIKIFGTTKPYRRRVATRDAAPQIPQDSPYAGYPTPAALDAVNDDRLVTGE